ncbi:hypothetical protein [Mangrovicella endophytica]|uniref:hypothetical protein n=1 Tax=Mangrovicella endophytica TaxID=2066697 RepID=UPI000C9DDF5F|nr:hypothetical protein [Mangrovicella endophytica]
MTEKSTASPLDATLKEAVGRYLAAHRASAAEAGGRAELAALLRRFVSSTVGDSAALQSPTAFRQAVPDIRDRLLREVRRLSRLGRAGHPAYDLNRHIALTRTLRWIDGEAAPRETKQRLSGHALNQRFRSRSWHRFNQSRTHRDGKPKSAIASAPQRP